MSEVRTVSFFPKLVLAGILALSPTWASAWWAMNRHEVFPVSDGVYEVVARVGSSASDFWCGAGDFAQRVIGLPAAERIYIWRGIGPSVNRPGRKAVQFALTPPPGADTTASLTLSVKAVGDNLARHAAVQYCYQHDGDDIWRRRW
ncbi:hypothetical protein ACFMPD_04030 [Sedimentitalea sp. HM32M-2]|uniref:hypothetical protein n=1 Tax=Sedimentitalea sp. HM32M-2 TaxID=3351566 RepID=UPI00363A9984